MHGPYIGVEEVGPLELEERVLGGDHRNTAVRHRGGSPADRGEAVAASVGTGPAVRAVHPERSLRAGSATRVTTCLWAGMTGSEPPPNEANTRLRLRLGEAGARVQVRQLQRTECRTHPAARGGMLRLKLHKRPTSANLPTFLF